MTPLAEFMCVDPPAAGLQRLRAGFSGHAYDRHRHETFAVGVTEAGLQCFHYRGTAWASTTGRIIVLYPDEVHDGHAGAPSGFAYSMLYVDPSLIAAALGRRALPFCGEPVFDDPALRSVLANAFVDFPQPIEDLARPTLVTTLAEALSRHAGALPPATHVSPKALDTARDLLHDASGSVSAATLETETGVDRYAHAACPLALLTGDFPAAEYYSTMLMDHSTRFALTLWRGWCHSFQGVLVIRRGDVLNGLQSLRTGSDEIGEAGFAIFQLISVLMAGALGRAGQDANERAAIEEMMARAERGEQHWAMAEFVRVRGELLLRGASGAAAAAEDHFRQALDCARQQGALSWELRAATSLARLLRNQGRPANAITCLQPIYDRFTEGFDTADLIAAKGLLDVLRPC